jgi:hypothetical protein
MHDQPVNPQHPSQFEMTALAELDQRVIRALEASPEPQIPDDFAARVASRVPASRPLSVTPTRYGHNAILISIAVLFAALFALAPHAVNRSVVGLTIECLLCAQFIGLTIWLSIRHCDAT